MTRAWLIAIAFTACSTTAKPDFYQQIDFAADGISHRADVFGGGDRQQLGFQIVPVDVVLGGEGLTQMSLMIDISALVDTDQPDQVEIQQLTVCDPRVTLAFSRGGDTFNVKPGDRNIDACTFGRSAGAIHGILAFQYMHETGTLLFAHTRFTFTQPSEPDVGIEHVLEYSPEFRFR